MTGRSARRHLRWLLPPIVVAGFVLTLRAQSITLVLDRGAERWVAQTFASLSLDEAIGQLIVSRFESTFTSSDSAKFDALAKLVDELHVGGFVIFGGSEPAPQVLLNPAYGTITLGDPYAAASLLNRLQARARVPLLNAADFEAGAGFRLAGSTVFPRAMAFGAVGDDRLAYESGRVTAIEGRALGVHVNFAPVVDVNNNPRNPVINTRSFGEDPERVGRLAAAYVRGLREGGMLATLKHFPGHGDTAIDTHLGLATVPHPRERLDQVELAPFRIALAADADAVMTGHLELPAIDPTPGVPATLSRPVITGLLRGDMRFDGLVYTDSLIMEAITKQMDPGQAAVRSLVAGNDIVLDSKDERAAIAAIKGSLADGTLARAQFDASVKRVLRAKALAHLHAPGARLVSLDELPARVGTREHRAVADEVSRRSITLVKDERHDVPLDVPRAARVLYLSLLDYPSEWRIGAPSRTVIPELKKRWPDVTAVELSDRSSLDEIELVRGMTSKFDAIVAGVFVRTASFSGRMDLAPPLVQLLAALARSTAERKIPLVTIVFGNPYAATFLSTLPALLVTYDLYDLAEASAVRAIAGEAAISGRLPIALPGLGAVGEGLDRAAR